MDIILNNRPETIDADSITIADLLKVKNYTFRMLVTKINGKLVKRDDYDKALVNNGDNVTILHLVSGG